MLRPALVGLLLLFAASSCRKGDDIDASGSFEAVETIISAEATGQVLALDLEEGQELDAGQVVGQIDSTQLAARRLQLVKNRRALLSGRPEAGVQAEALRKELARAVADRDRTARLVQGAVATQRQLDDANAAVATLQARLAAQESSLRVATTSIDAQASTVDAQLAELDDQLRKSTIVNPIRGTVLTKYAEPFEMTVVGRPLYRIADLSTIILRAYITGDQLARARLNQAVTVLADDGKGGFREAEGVITWISDKAEFTPKTIQTRNERANLVYAVKVRVANDGAYKIGMYGALRFAQP